MTTRYRTSNKALNRRIDKYVKLTLTNAQMLALFTTPVTIIPAVAGFAHIVSEVYATLPAQATGATIGSSTGIILKYTNGSGSAVSGTIPVTGFLDQTANTQAFADASSAYLITPNVPIVITMSGANVTGMTGTVSFRVYYKTLPNVL